jgi:hypothetical protein
LGLKKLEEWNKASILRHVWALFTRSGSLWVAWVKANLIKGRCFRLLKVSHDSAWSWRKILKLWEVAKNFLKFQVGDGTNISLWMDNWHPEGVLNDKYGFWVIDDARSCIDAKLSSVIRGKDWHWNPARSDDLVATQSGLSFAKIGLVDNPLRLPSRKFKYTCKDTWEAIRVKQPKVEWSDLFSCGWLFGIVLLRETDY